MSQLSFLAFALENKEAEKVFDKRTKDNNKRGQYQGQDNFVHKCEQQRKETFFPYIGIA